MISLLYRCLHDPFFCLQSEVEETLKRIAAHKGVMGYIVLNQDGKILYSIFFVLWGFLGKTETEKNFFHFYMEIFVCFLNGL